jgi:hypothetical protein
MDIGLTGEAYANFGFRSGLIYFAILMLLLAAGLRFFGRWAQKRPLLWAWVPFVAFYWATGEAAFGDCFDYAVKASAVFCGVLVLSPAWRAALTGRELPLRRVAPARSPRGRSRSMSSRPRRISRRRTTPPQPGPTGAITLPESQATDAP